MLFSRTLAFIVSAHPLNKITDRICERVHVFYVGKNRTIMMSMRSEVAALRRDMEYFKTKNLAFYAAS